MRLLKPLLSCLAVLCVAAANLPAAVAPPAAAANLVPNPGLEAPVARGLPAGWESLVIGAPARLEVDRSERHGGAQSVRLTASEVARAYLRSGPIEVAPGERLRIEAWARVRGVPPAQGSVIVIAEFTDAADAGAQVAKAGVADVTRPDWQRVSGTVAVPPGMARLRLRLGFSYSHGTCWWDDVTVAAEQPLAVRAELTGPRLSPAVEPLPVAVLNREGRRGRVTVTAGLGPDAAAAEVELTGALVQRAGVPLRITRRGRSVLEVTLREAGRDAPLFEEKRRVTVPPPLTLSPPLPTHWVREDGPPRLEGEIELAIPAAECRGGRLAARLLDAAGKVRAEWESPAGRPAPNGLTRFDLRTPALPEGEYRLSAEFRPADGEAVRDEQAWAVIPRRRARVTLNRDGYLEQDGRTIFPLGIFNGGARMAEAGAAGFTVSHAYNAVRVHPGQKPDDQRARQFLDATEQAGMRALFLVPMSLAIAGDWDGFRRRIRLFRNHPALLAWDEEEGIARGDMRPELLAKIRSVLREEDPHHPLMVGDSRDLINRVTDRSDFFPLKWMDLGMWWWYPFPLRPRPGDALQGEEVAEHLLLQPPTFLTLRKTEKPIWVGVQSYKKPQPWGRYPTPAEYRAQAYLALIHGAKGLMWYGGSVQGGLFLSPKEGHWEALKALAGELNALSDVLTAPAAGAPRIHPAAAPVSAAIREGKRRRVLLAVNRGSSEVTVDFELPGLGPAPVPVLGESRTVLPVEGRLRDRFQPYGTHVYELPE